MRLFFAIALPDNVRSILARIRDDSSDYRWVDPEGMHVTLAFLGEQPEERLASLKDVGARVAAASEAGTLSLGGVDTFGSRRAPRVVWVGLSGDLDRLLALQGRLSRALVNEHFPVEDREFNPHITLARRRPRATGGPPTNWPPTIEKKQFPMRELTLFQSQLSPRGATYVALSTHALGG